MLAIAENPLVPTGIDIALEVVGVFAALLLVAAVLSILVTKNLGWRIRLVAIVVAVLVPIAGPIAWFCARRRVRASASAR